MFILDQWKCWQTKKNMKNWTTILTGPAVKKLLLLNLWRPTRPMKPGYENWIVGCIDTWTFNTWGSIKKSLRAGSLRTLDLSLFKMMLSVLMIVLVSSSSHVQNQTAEGLYCVLSLHAADGDSSSKHKLRLLQSGQFVSIL